MRHCWNKYSLVQKNETPDFLNFSSKSKRKTTTNKGMPSLRKCFWYWKRSLNNLSTCIDAAPGSCKCQIHLRVLKLKRDLYSAFPNVRNTVDLDRLPPLDVWTSRDICEIDFAGLLGAFWQTGSPSFWLRARGLPLPCLLLIIPCWVIVFFQLSIEGSPGHCR